MSGNDFVWQVCNSEPREHAYERLSENVNSIELRNTL